MPACWLVPSGQGKGVRPPAPILSTLRLCFLPCPALGAPRLQVRPGPVMGFLLFCNLSADCVKLSGVGLTRLNKALVFLIKPSNSLSA